jgi:leader peptidase (prepilin peptidase)/N-methyltransferase
MLEAVLALLCGLLIGSFLNVCIYRLPRDLSVVRPRSFCPACGHMVAWFDNVPLVSYALLRGRCRYCKAAIPARYPVVELLTGMLFFLAVESLGVSLAALKLCVFGALLVGLIFADLEERILPDEFTLGGTAAGVVMAFVVPMEPSLAYLFVSGSLSPALVSVSESVLGALVGGGAIWLVGALYQKLRHREGLGFGDVKMVAMIGAFLGLRGVLGTLLLGSVAGSVVGLVFIVLTRKEASTYELPFGSFLGAAAIFIAFLGTPLLNWYLQFGT